MEVQATPKISKLNISP